MSPVPTVSVVIPTYNRAGWLPASVNSVLTQTVPALEILIVDDGSTDQSADICARFPAPVRYIRQENAGVSVARNRGMREAKGEWIALLDSDDLWMPEKLAVQLALHAAHPQIGWSTTGALTVGPEGTVVGARQGFERVFEMFDGLGQRAEEFFDHWLERVALQTGGIAYRAWAGDCYAALFLGNFILPSAVLLRRELIDRVGGFNPEFRVAEDAEFFHRVAAASPIGVLADALCRYRVGLGGAQTSPANAVRILQNALQSGHQAARLRDPLPPAAQSAYTLGRRRMLLELAYTQLSVYDGAGARASVREAWQAGARSSRAAAIYSAGLLPAPVLGLLHGMKRRLRAGA